MAQRLSGILIGPEELRLVTLRTRKQGYQVLAAAAHDLSPEERIAPGAALKGLFKRVKVPPKTAALCLAKEQVTLNNAILPSTDPEELKEMARFEAERTVPFNAERFSFGFKLLQPAPGGGSEVLLAAADGQSTDRALAAAAEAGVKPQGLNVASACLLNALMHQYPETARDRTVALLSIGANTLDLVFADRGRLLLSRSVPVGLASLIGDLYSSQGQSLQALDSARVATAAKMIDMIDLEQNYVSPEGRRPTLGPKAVGTARQWAARLIQELRRSYDFVRREHGCPPVECVVICGEGAVLRNLDHYLYVNLNLEIKVLNPLAEIIGDKAKDLPFGGLELTIPFGAAIQDAVQNGYRIDLTPRSYYKRIERRALWRQITIASIFGLVAAGSGGAAWLNLRDTHVQMAKEYTAVNDAMRPVVAALHEQETQLKILQSNLDDPGNALAVLLHIARFQEKNPSRVMVKSVTFKHGAETLIEGHAKDLTDVTKFVEHLQNAQPRLFEGVQPIDQKLTEALSKRPKVYVFRIACVMAPYESKNSPERLTDSQLVELLSNEAKSTETKFIPSKAPKPAATEVATPPPATTPRPISTRIPTPVGTPAPPPGPAPKIGVGPPPATGGAPAAGMAAAPAGMAATPAPAKTPAANAAMPAPPAPKATAAPERPKAPRRLSSPKPPPAKTPNPPPPAKELNKP